MIKVVGLGAGGHAKVVIEILSQARDIELIGLVDSREDLWQTEVLGVPVLGGDELLSELYQKGVRHIFLGVGSVGDTRPRERLYDLIRSQGFEPVAAIDTRAIISPSVQMDLGPTIMAGAIINAQARLAENVIVNSGAIIEHDCQIGAHCHIATGAVLAGNVTVEPRAHIGAGATVRQGIRVGEGAVVGAGAVVVKDVPPRMIVTGTPARPLRPV